MGQNRRVHIVIISILFSILFTSSLNQSASANDILDVPELFQIGQEHFFLGEYAQAIVTFDKILEISPNDTKTLLLKGTALSNLDRHKNSILEFKKVLATDPDNLIALLGVGVGFGNFGEYKQAHKYFSSAYEISPENHIAENYMEFAEKVIVRYPYNEVAGPKIHQVAKVEVVPDWVKNSAGWWADNKITDTEFISSLQFLIKNSIIKIDDVKETKDNSSTLPSWIKNNAGWWAANEITDQDFLSGIYYMIENGIIVIEIPEKGEITKEEQLVLDRNLWEFERYLDRIIKTIENDTRYIEYPNPSGDVIKKFMRDYHKWNFEQQLKMGTDSFPSPTYTENDETFLLTYKVYVNEQPKGLPLDHVSTLNNSFAYWEGRTLKAENGYDVKINFVRTESKSEANLWVTWGVRSLGENVLGHANLGKGVVEVALGGYGCDGNFQLYHVDTVEKIMTHELGHGIGLMHSTNRDSIMYPSLQNTQYAYCLLDVNKQFTKDVSGIVLKKQS